MVHQGDPPRLYQASRDDQARNHQAARETHDLTGSLSCELTAELYSGGSWSSSICVVMILHNDRDGRYGVVRYPYIGIEQKYCLNRHKHS